MYNEELMDHYRHPRNKKKLESPDFTIADRNPSCGDEVAIEGCVADGVVTALSFRGAGCVISQAATSMLTEYAIGKKIDSILSMTKDDITAMIEMPLGPNRLKCALLCLMVLQEGLKRYSNDL